jgi:hypothetical protein
MATKNQKTMMSNIFIKHLYVSMRWLPAGPQHPVQPGSDADLPAARAGFSGHRRRINRFRGGVGAHKKSRSFRAADAKKESSFLKKIWRKYFFSFFPHTNVVAH